MDILSAVEEFLIDAAAALYGSIGWVGVAILMTIESTIIPLPSEVILTLAGWQLIQAQGDGWPQILFGGLVGALASVLGALIQYSVARIAGRPFVIRYGKWLLLTRADLDRVDRWFEHHGIATIIILRLIPGLRGVVSIPAGVAHVNILLFSTLVFIASLPWTTFLVWLGFTLGDNYDAISAYLRPFYIPIGVVVVAAVAFFIYRRVRTIRREARSG